MRQTCITPAGWLVVYYSQTRDVEPMLFSCWPIICDAGPPLKQHLLNVSCFQGVLDTGTDVIRNLTGSVNKVPFYRPYIPAPRRSCSYGLRKWRESQFSTPGFQRIHSLFYGRILRWDVWTQQMGNYHNLIMHLAVILILITNRFNI